MDLASLKVSLSGGGGVVLFWQADIRQSSAMLNAKNMRMVERFAMIENKLFRRWHKVENPFCTNKCFNTIFAAQ